MAVMWYLRMEKCWIRRNVHRKAMWKLLNVKRIYFFRHSSYFYQPIISELYKGKCYYFGWLFLLDAGIKSMFWGSASNWGRLELCFNTFCFLAWSSVVVCQKEVSVKLRFVNWYQSLGPKDDILIPRVGVRIWSCMRFWAWLLPRVN